MCAKDNPGAVRRRIRFGVVAVLLSALGALAAPVMVPGKSKTIKVNTSATVDVRSGCRDFPDIPCDRSVVLVTGSIAVDPAKKSCVRRTVSLVEVLTPQPPQQIVSVKSTPDGTFDLGALRMQPGSIYWVEVTAKVKRKKGRKIVCQEHVNGSFGVS